MEAFIKMTDDVANNVEKISQKKNFSDTFAIFFLHNLLKRLQVNFEFKEKNGKIN